MFRSVRNVGILISKYEFAPSLPDSNSEIWPLALALAGTTETLLSLYPIPVLKDPRYVKSDCAVTAVDFENTDVGTYGFDVLVAYGVDGSGGTTLASAF